MSARWSRQRLDIRHGAKYGQWEVVREAEPNARGGRRFLCRCTCGTERPVFIGHLRNGQSRSCGCAQDARHPAIAEVPTRFGAELESLIKARGMRSVDVARAMKTSPNTVYNYIYNLTRPVPPIIDRVATGIGATDEERRELHLAAARDRGYRV